MKNLIEKFTNDGNQVILITDYAPVDGRKEYELPATVKRVSLNEYCKSPEKPSNRERVLLLRRILISESPDVAVSFLGPPNYRMLVASLGLKHKVIVSVRNDPKKEYGTGLRKAIANILFRLADGVVFQTSEAASYFAKSIRKKSKITFNPVEPEFFRREWKNNGNEIVAIGRLQQQKNPKLLLEAYIQIADEFPGSSLGYYGDGEMRDGLKALAEQNGLSDRIHFYGISSDVPAVLENAALFVLSSDYEGLPNALMEAMAVGAPVISTDCPCGGPRSLIQNPSQGELVPCGNADKLARALCDLLSNHERQIQMSICERERAKQFHPAIVCSEWVQFINGICSD